MLFLGQHYPNNNRWTTQFWHKAWPQSWLPTWSKFNRSTGLRPSFFLPSMVSRYFPSMCQNMVRGAELCWYTFWNFFAKIQACHCPVLLLVAMPKYICCIKCSKRVSPKDRKGVTSSSELGKWLESMLGKELEPNSVICGVCRTQYRRRHSANHIYIYIVTLTWPWGLDAKVTVIWS